jgi:hypothetical protein
MQHDMDPAKRFPSYCRFGRSKSVTDSGIEVTWRARSETRGTVAFYAIHRALNAFCFRRHTKQVTPDSFRDINIILMSAYRHFIGRFPDGNFNGLLAGQAFDALTTASPVGNIVFWKAGVQPITGHARDETIADDHPKR